MQTNFSPEQLRDAGIAHAESILRKCVHCGFCTATCPTYVTLGDELDSPRGRIYMIKDMLENNRPADEKLVKHVDRCLSCLSCMTTCPSGVNYMHLLDEARAHIERTYKRPLLDRIYRDILASILPRPGRFRFAMVGGMLAKPLSGLFSRFEALKPLTNMVSLAPKRIPAKDDRANKGIHSPKSPARKRVALLSGCVQPVLDPAINGATVELLNRLGVEVVIPAGEGCCGSLVHHMGREHQAMEAARRNIDVWMKEKDSRGLDAIIITASGCGTTIKDYGHMLHLDPDYGEKAATISSLAMDITEFLTELDPEPVETGNGIRIAYHSACSLQHGQKVRNEPKTLLKNAGFEVVDVPESHLCCGSAGVYNILQGDIAAKLKTRKVGNIERTKPVAIAAGNIGCIVQIGSGTEIPILHTVQLLNWAYGGKKPAALEGIIPSATDIDPFDDRKMGHPARRNC